MPHLTREREVELIRVAKAGTAAQKANGSRSVIEAGREAKADLIDSCRGMIYRLAKREHNRYPRSEIEDLAQAGVIGLLHAIEHFDEDRGFRLLTFAAWHIRQQMQRFHPSGYSVRPPQHFCTEDEHVSRALKTESLNAVDYDTVSSMDKDETEAKEIWAMLWMLPKRERRILEERFRHDYTLSKIGDGLGLSKERVRQLQVAALNRIKKWLKVATKAKKPRPLEKWHCSKCRLEIWISKARVARARKQLRNVFCDACRPAPRPSRRRKVAV